MRTVGSSLTLLLCVILLVTACQGELIEENDVATADGEAGAAGEDAGDQPRAGELWDFFIFVPSSHPIGEFAQEFAERVEEVTDGDLQVNIRPVGELPISADEAVEAVQRGDVQLADGYSGFIAGTTRVAALPALPFLVTDGDELREVMPAVLDYVNEDLSRFGVEVLFWYGWPMQNIFGSGEPVRSLEELGGRTIRASSAEQVALLDALGADSVTLTTEEVPTALETGVAEGVLTAAFNAIGSGWGDFIDWAYLPGVTAAPSYILVDSAAMEALDPDTRERVRSAATEFGEQMTEEIFSVEDGHIEELASEFDATITPGDPADVEMGAQLMEDYWDQWAAAGGETLETAVQEVRAQLGR